MSVQAPVDSRRDVIVTAAQLVLLCLVVLTLAAASWLLYECTSFDPVARAVQEVEDDAVRRETVARVPEVARQERDMEQLQGGWDLAGGERDGIALAADVVRRSRLRVTGDEHVTTLGSDTFRGTYTLQPLRTPGGIEAQDVTGPLSGGTALGVYELTGDVFRVCFAAPGDARPGEFTTRSGTGRLLLVWQRRPTRP